MQVSVELTMPSGWGDGLFGSQAWRVVREELHKGSQELADLEVYNISARTPVDTGALLSDLQGEAYPDPGDSTLAVVSYGTENQVSEWGRVYMLYQEGGELGLPTYTNPPREMIALALTEDIGWIEVWALEHLTNAADRIAGGF